MHFESQTLLHLGVKRGPNLKKNKILRFKIYIRPEDITLVNRNPAEIYEVSARGRLGLIRAGAAGGHQESNRTIHMD